MTINLIYGTLMLTMNTPTQTPTPEPRGSYKPKKPVVKTNRVILTRAIWYMFGVITALLALRIVLLMLSANPETPFVEFVYAISSIFVVPFYGIFDQPDYTRFYVDTSSIVAIVVYWLLAVGLTKLVNLTR
jgi:YGGT family